MDHAGYMRNGAAGGGGGGGQYHPNLYMNDLSNLSSDLPPTYDNKQVSNFLFYNEFAILGRF